MQANFKASQERHGKLPVRWALHELRAAQCSACSQGNDFAHGETVFYHRKLLYIDSKCWTLWPQVPPPALLASCSSSDSQLLLAHRKLAQRTHKGPMISLQSNVSVKITNGTEALSQNPSFAHLIFRTRKQAGASHSVGKVLSTVGFVRQ